MAKTIKSIALGVFMLGTAMLFWYFLHTLFYTEVPTLALRIWSLVFFFVFAVLASLTCFLTDLRSVAFSALAASGLSFFVFFGYNKIYLIGVILLLVALFVCYENILSEKKVRIKVSLRKSIHSGLPYILTFTVIMISIAYYFAPAIQAQVYEIKIPKPVFDQGILKAEVMISGFMPGFKKDMTVDEFIFQMTISQIEQQIEQQEKLELPQDVINFLRQEGVDTTSKEEIIKAIRENPKVQEKFMEMIKQPQEEGDLGPAAEIFKGLGVEIKEDELLTDVLYKATNQKLNEALGPWKKYIPLAAAVSLFIILKILMIPFYWVILLSNWLLFVLLKATQVVRIEKVQKEVEVVTM